jgi:hypothetical protein
MQTRELYNKDEAVRPPIQNVFIGVYAYRVDRVAVYEFAHNVFCLGKGLCEIEFFVRSRQTPYSIKVQRQQRRMYYGTDYDNQRNGEVFEIACNNDM